jgi:hypothetical protein
MLLLAGRQLCSYVTQACNCTQNSGSIFFCLQQAMPWCIPDATQQLTNSCTKITYLMWKRVMLLYHLRQNIPAAAAAAAAAATFTPCCCCCQPGTCQCSNQLLLPLAAAHAANHQLRLQLLRERYWRRLAGVLVTQQHLQATHRRGRIQGEQHPQVNNILR